MRKEAILVIIVFSLIQFQCSTSKKAAKESINEADITRIESVLSHDSLEGRKVFTPGIEKAAVFIESEMKGAGLIFFNSFTNYRQTFSLISNSITSSAIYAGESSDLNTGHSYCISAKTALHVDMNSGYKIVRIANEEEYVQQARTLLQSKENLWVLLDKSLEKRMARLKAFSRYILPPENDILFTIVPDINANNYAVDIAQVISKNETSNIIGMLPGKKTPGEYVIFSGHYDHLGYSKPDEKGDSLYNGANDDASGITAVLSLAKYFAKQNNNDRSILFIAFTAEELGTLGSEYFGKTIDPEKVVAMINVEMIGTSSKWGDSAAFITGYELSDLGSILQKNMDTKTFKYYPDPYTEAKLFYRSDNASMAKLGVPAHTISTSQMDKEPHYHKPSDEISTLDMKNMMRVIKAIAISTQTIINKKDTPSRIPPLTN